MMLQRLTLSIGFGAALLGLGANAQSVVTVKDLDPFTHIAFIPKESNLTSIRFEKVELIKVPTKLRSITRISYCPEMVFRDPGGSMYCPHTRFEAETAAYKVTYSYTAQAMTADEQRSRSFVFSVYYRPEEVSPAIREAISRGKGRDSDVAGLFDVKTLRLPEQRIVLDGDNSNVCEGNLIDGAWNQANSRCKSDLKYKTVTVAGDYVSVRIDLSLPKVSQR